MEREKRYIRTDSCNIRGIIHRFILLTSLFFVENIYAQECVVLFHGYLKNNKCMKPIANILEDKKAENINIIDLQNTTSLTRYMIFANGRSSRNIIAIADYVADELKKSGHPYISIEGLGQAEWVLMDAGDAIVHLFQPEMREHYKLEDLWKERKDI